MIVTQTKTTANAFQRLFANAKKPQPLSRDGGFFAFQFSLDGRAGLSSPCLPVHHGRRQPERTFSPESRRPLLRWWHQAGNRGRVLQSGARHFRRIDHTGLDQIFVLIGLSVVAEVGTVVLADLAHYDCAFFARVLDDLTNRLLAGATDDVDTNLLTTGQLHTLQRRGRTGCTQRVFDAPD
jgi:hypothetical protein